MSTRTDSNKQKQNSFSEASEALYDPYLEFPIDETFTKVPWPEWNDADLNSETWDIKSTVSVGKASTGTITAVLYDDPHAPSLPAEIREYVSTWKRPSEVFPATNLTVYDQTNSDFELSVPSPVAECNFSNRFKELLTMLQYYALKVGFGVEMETAAFVSTTQGEPWRPWHHVYGQCKAGKGQTHRPVYCPYGKYVVRLFYFGAWRKFVVDDWIPCDKYGLCMLPVTQVEGELWPIVLAKGLLKIISMTSSLIDFPYATFFTGWVNGYMGTTTKTHEQIWRRLQILTPRYEIPEGDEIQSSRDASVLKESTKNGPESVKQQESKSDKFCVVWASLGGFTPDETDFLHDQTSIITMNRDMPLFRANRKEPTKRWKRLRWVYWASEKGLWTDESLLPPYRRLQCITFAPGLSKVLSPDPVQEATLYALPENDGYSEEPSESGDGFEPLMWSDFYKMCEYLININVQLKPSCCTSNFKMTSVGSGSSSKDLVTPATAKTAPKAEPQDFYFYSPVLTPTLNQPVILYCESLTGIFICFSLWVCPGKKKTLTGYLDPGQPEVFKVGHACLIVEQFDWRTLRQGKILSYAKTVGNSSTLVNLKPGRHALRLWLSTDSPYTLNMYSNVSLCLHKGKKIRGRMSAESESILDYIASISNSFMALTQKFGKPDLSTALRDFYEALKPGNDNDVGYHGKIDSFIDVFLKCVMEALKSLIPNVDELKIMLGALRSLFINPSISCDLPRGQPASLYGTTVKKGVKKINFDVTERSLSEILSYPWSLEEIRQIVAIQRIFRGYRVRLLWKYQTPARKECKPYTEKLKKICDTIFSSAKRDVEVGKIIRMVVRESKTLLTTYKFHEDFSKVLEVEEFTGKVLAVEPFAWVPLARFIIASHGSEPVPCAFYLSCNLEQYVVLAVDNDTNEEIFSLSNILSPHYYASNNKGYTVFVYGWNEANVKTVNWRLEMVKMKYFEVIHLCNVLLALDCHPYTMPALDVCEIKNFYVPNCKSRICRCCIKIQKRSLLSLRLSTSYSDVEFVLTISLDNRYCDPNTECSSDGNNVLARIYSKNGAAFVPALVLEPHQFNEWWEGREDESTLYILEAFVRDNSWPLTKQEWGVVEPIRVNADAWKDVTSNMQLKKAGSESRRKLTRISKRSLQERNVENPFWLLQVLNDTSDGDPSETMVVEEDRSYYESIKAMKMSWEEKNPGRRRKGKDLRIQFLHAMHLENRANQAVEEGIDIEAEKEGDRFDSTESDDFRELLHKMTSFSYLTTDKSPTRYAKSPRVLPWMPTQRLLEQYRYASDGAGTRISTTEDSDYYEPDTFCTSANENESRRQFLATCNRYRQILVSHFEEEQKISVKLIEQGYKQRLKIAQRMTGCEN